MADHEVETVQVDAVQAEEVMVEDYAADPAAMVVDAEVAEEALPELMDGRESDADIEEIVAVTVDDELDVPSDAHGESVDEPQDAAGADDATPPESGDTGGAESDGSTTPRRSGKARLAQLEREGEVAADFLERLLDIADLDGDIDVDVDGDRAAVAIVDSEEGQVPRRLVGPEGRVLDALQDLTRLAVQTATGERSRLMLDVAGFRAQRRAAVVDIANAVIERVRETGAPQPLEPMTAFERKVVHDEAAGAGLVSESEGAEPNRYVVIQPA
jgi:spoIIIJ-associated protein